MLQARCPGRTHQPTGLSCLNFGNLSLIYNMMTCIYESHYLKLTTLASGIVVDRRFGHFVKRVHSRQSLAAHACRGRTSALPSTIYRHS